MNIHFRKKKLFQAAISLLFATCPISTFASGIEPPQNASWFESDELVSEQVNYLSTHPLYPFLDGGRTEYAAIGFAEYPGDSEDIAFPLGKIFQGDTSYLAMFFAKKGNEAEVRLLCIAKDQLPSPVLFADILTATLPKIELPYFHVFIEQLESPDLPEDQILQRWVFFTPEANKEFHVFSTPDGQGGTYFTILEPEE